MKKSDLTDDSGIVEACVKGDLDAWERLVNRYSPLIRAAISNRIRSYGMSLPSQDIEDILQNVLTSIWIKRRLAEVKNRANISYWLAIVSGNTAVEYLRAIKSSGANKTISLRDTPNEGEEIPDNGRDETPPCPDPEKNNIPDKLKTALECLRKKEKLIMRLYIFHNKKYGEIAKILNMPEGTVASCIRRSKTKLKRILK